MKKINLDKIIAVSGLPGLYKIISNGTKGVIVENITDKKRTVILNTNKIFSLDTIRIYTNTSDNEKPLAEALFNIYEMLDKQAAPHHKNSSDEEVKSFFEKAIPDYDKEKVNINNMRKLFQWYNILQQSNMLQVIEESSQTSQDENDTTSDKIQTNITEEVTEQNTETSPKKRGGKRKPENES